MQRGEVGSQRHPAVTALYSCSPETQSPIASDRRRGGDHRTLRGLVSELELTATEDGVPTNASSTSTTSTPFRETHSADASSSSNPHGSLRPANACAMPPDAEAAPAAR